MKKILFTAAALAIIAVPASSMAGGDSIYLKGNVGIGMAMDTDINNMPDAAGSAKMTYDSGFLGTLAAL